MQGQRGAVGSLPDVLGFDHGSTSGDAGLDQQVRWTSTINSAQNRLPDYMMSTNNTSVGYLNAANQQGHGLGGWDFGESSSRPSESTPTDQKAEHVWSSPINVRSGAILSSERQQQPSHILALNNVSMNLHNNVEGHGTLFTQNSDSSIAPRDLNMNSEYVADDDDDCQVVECPNAYKSGGSVNERMPSASSSSHPFGVSSGNGGFLVDESDGRPGCSSLDGRRLSCKRKALEGNIGQSSGSGSTSYIQHPQGSLWHAASIRHNSSSSTSITTPAEHSIGINMPEQVNPRLGLSVGHVASESTPALSVPGTTEIARRNFRLRINASHQQNSVPSGMFSTETGVGGATISSTQQQPLRLLPRNSSLDLRPTSAAENTNPQGHTAAPQVSSLRRNQRWHGASSSRAGSLSSYANSGSRDAAPYEVSTPVGGPPPRNISDYPMFIPPSDTRNSLPNPPNWSFGGGNVSIPGNIASPSRSGSSAGGVHSAGPPWVFHRNPTQYSRRVSEYVRRSLLASTDPDPSGQNSNFPALQPGASASQEMPLPSGSSSHGRHANSRAMLLERHLDGALGIPYSLRTLAAASEGRSRLVSEVCATFYNLVTMIFSGSYGMLLVNIFLSIQSSVVAFCHPISQVILECVCQNHDHPDFIDLPQYYLTKSIFFFFADSKRFGPNAQGRRSTI